MSEQVVLESIQDMKDAAAGLLLELGPVAHADLINSVTEGASTGTKLQQAYCLLAAVGMNEVMAMRNDTMGPYRGREPSAN